MSEQFDCCDTRQEPRDSMVVSQTIVTAGPNRNMDGIRFPESSKVTFNFSNVQWMPGGADVADQFRGRLCRGDRTQAHELTAIWHMDNECARLIPEKHPKRQETGHWEQVRVSLGQALRGNPCFEWDVPKDPTREGWPTAKRFEIRAEGHRMNSGDFHRTLSGRATPLPNLRLTLIQRIALNNMA